MGSKMSFIHELNNMNKNKYHQALYNNEMLEEIKLLSKNELKDDSICNIIRDQYTFSYIKTFKLYIQENKRFYNH